MEYPFFKKHLHYKNLNNNSNIQDVKVLSHELSNFLNINEVKYKVEHVKNIERDAIKVNKYRERMKERELYDILEEVLEEIEKY